MGRQWLQPFLDLASGFLILSFFIGCHCDDNPLVFSTKECFLKEPVYNHTFAFSALRSDLAHVVVSEQGDTFEYNICGVIARSCDGRHDAAACLRTADKEYVLGTQHELHYNKGKMFFSFSNGSKCDHSNEPYKLHVSLGCDYTPDKNQSHVTLYANDACSFYITLKTVHACLPEPLSVATSSCSVKNPHNNRFYDLLPLSDTNYRIPDRNGSSFVINICKPVLYDENAMCPPGSSICFVSLRSNEYKKKYFDYGTAHGNPVIENGVLLLRHNSSTSCNNTHNYSTVIHFYCDKDVQNAHPQFDGAHGCLYEFSFNTPLACNVSAPCTAVTHNNEIVDLSSLANKSFTLPLNGANFTFAVCSNAGAPCIEGKDGACRNEGGQTTSLGVSNALLRYNQSGTLYLQYDSGAACTQSKFETYWSTKIEFVCAMNATAEHSDTVDASGIVGNVTAVADAFGPKIIENRSCQLLIHYQTPLACQEQIKCQAKVYVDRGTDGKSEEVVDLTPLITYSENYEAKIDLSPADADQQKKLQANKFFLNVCRPLVPHYGLGCPGGSAACMAKVGTAATATPEEEQSLGFPLVSMEASNRTTALLRYSKGSTCLTDNKQKLSSGIEFYCDMHAGRGTPVLRSISNCHYQFQWATNVICPPHTCHFDSNTCSIINEEVDASYSLRHASFTADGKLRIPRGKTLFEVEICGPNRTAVTDYSQNVVNVFFRAEGPCGTDGMLNVQMRLTCSSQTDSSTTFNDDPECNLVYVQRTPDICNFLGVRVPPGAKEASSGASSTQPEAAPHSSTTEQVPKSSNVDHVARSGSSLGAFLAVLLSLSFLGACCAALALSPERRRGLRRLFRRSSSAVRYSRVQSNEEANLLLEPNGEFTDSDDDMLL